MKSFELAKRTYEKRKGIKVNSLTPVFIKGTGKHSEVLYNIDGKKVFLCKFGKKDYDFISAR